MIEDYLKVHYGNTWMYIPKPDNQEVHEVVTNVGVPYETFKNDYMPFVRKDRIADRDYFKQLQFCEEIYEFDDGGKHHKIVNKYITRYTFKPELENLLKYMGFEVLETYGDFKGTEFGKTPYAGDIIMFSKVKER